MDNELRQHYKTWAVNHASQLSRVHQQMLDLRRSGLDQISRTISQSMGKGEPSAQTGKVILFDKNWLNEFASGDIVKCLGEEFAIYKNRRSPRIPNGDLLLMSRIVSIQGKRGEFSSPSQIAAEIDVPTDAWYFDGSVQGEIPLSILLEIGLQPCGVLSAWLGTQLRFPLVDFFFRNLDGEVRLIKNIDARGKTIHTNAVLLKTVFSGSTIIQHFEFELLCEGELFFKGTTSFGYFPEESMATQNGLDGGNTSLSWGEVPENKSTNLQRLNLDNPVRPDLPTGKLRLLHEISISPTGGNKSRGYALATRHNSPDDWFYTNHFFQDPVMPGSLGIEAVVQAFKSAVHAITHSDKPVNLATGVNILWKYRGQVLQHHHQMQVEVHIQDQQIVDGSIIFTGAANLWADDIRIYEIQNLAVQQEQGMTQ